MRDAFHLALSYMRHQRGKTLVLIVATALLLVVPLAMQILVGQAEARLLRRAAATPLVVGARGSPVELVLRAVYFGEDPPKACTYAEVERIEASGLALPIPLHARFHAQGARIVGTTLEYLSFRDLRLADGRAFAALGECVLGSAVARARGLGVGDTITSSPESVFDLAGVYPLRMRVVGVLVPSGSPDDEIVLTDVKTAWLIQGLAHGHAPTGEGAEHVHGAEEVRTFNEVTPENLSSFHFHGDMATYPITAILPVPESPKAETILRGRYQGRDEAMQILQPTTVIEGVFDKVLRVRSLILAALLVIAVAALAAMVLVFVLSWRMRRAEFQTMRAMGASRGRIRGVVLAEVMLVLLAGALLAALLAWGIQALGLRAVESLLA